jgi:hypothetical protein
LPTRSHSNRTRRTASTANTPTGSGGCWCNERVFNEFRALPRQMQSGTCSGAVGPGSPRFSGRRAPLHPAASQTCRIGSRAKRIARGQQCRLLAGGGPIPCGVHLLRYRNLPAARRVQPRDAFCNADLRIHLPCDIVRQSTSPDEKLHAFLQTTYEAAADLGKWDRPLLERAASIC